MMNKLGLVFLLLIGLLAVSCSTNSQTESGTAIFELQGENGFVGTVNGTDAFIAVLISGEEAVVYVCNGDEEIQEWFKGEISDPADFRLTNDLGATVQAQFADNSITGEVTLSNGNTYSFAATPNVGENTGIYRVFGEEAAQDGINAGWIVNSAGEERGALRIGVVFRKAPPIKDINDGTSNTVVINARTFPVRHTIIAPNNVITTNYQGTDGADVAR